MADDDIIFICPKCRQWLEAPGDLTGMFVECPKCGDIVKVPAASQNPDDVECNGELTAPPPPEADDAKGSTVKIELPSDLDIPPPAHKKRFILRRPS